MKDYEGICNACGRESKYLERDHRVPPRLGGARRHQTNLQDLCLECHKRKTMLEGMLMDFNCNDDTVREWLLLAFQGDAEALCLFAGNMQLRVSHIKEIIAKTNGTYGQLRDIRSSSSETTLADILNENPDDNAGNISNKQKH